jgi:apoptosis-inducing factor 3
VQIVLSDYPINIVHRVVHGPIELLLRLKSGSQVEVSPALCPHEGGLIDERHLCDGQAVCPWHGRRFGPVLLGSGALDAWRYLSVTVRYKGDHLEVDDSSSEDPRQSDKKFASKATGGRAAAV